MPRKKIYKSGDIETPPTRRNGFHFLRMRFAERTRRNGCPLFANEVRGEEGGEEVGQIRENQPAGVESAGKEEKNDAIQKQELNPFAKVKFRALKAAYPHLSEAEIKEIARKAAEEATETFGKMVEAGADPWAVREQILHDLSQPTTPEQQRPIRRRSRSVADGDAAAVRRAQAGQLRNHQP